MREIKYKVLDKSSQEFISDNGLTLKEIQNINNIDHFEFIQYTGLKDKNDVEIYESDIVMYSTSAYAGGEEERQGVIGFEHGSFVLYFSYPKKAYTSLMPHDFRIIGNIYENKELL